jgi:hypothetical protein
MSFVPRQSLSRFAGAGAGWDVAIARSVMGTLLRANSATFEKAPRPVGQGPHLAFQIQLLAAEQVLRGKNYVDGAVAGDAEAIRQHFRGCKRPAGAAVSLVANGVHTCAPLISSIKRCGEIVELDRRSSATFR